MYPIRSIIIACSLAELTWCLPEFEFMGPRYAPAPDTANIGPLTRNLGVPTASSLSTYTQIYVSPTAKPQILEESENPRNDDDENEGPDFEHNRPAPKMSVCLTSTVTFGIVHCKGSMLVSSHHLQSTLFDCSTTFSTASGCAVTITKDVPTATMDSSTEDSTATSNLDIGYAPETVMTDTESPDDPNWMSYKVFKQAHLAAPVDPPRSNLSCPEQDQSTAASHWKSAHVSVLIPIIRCRFADRESLQGTRPWSFVATESILPTVVSAQIILNLPLDPLLSNSSNTISIAPGMQEVQCNETDEIYRSSFGCQSNGDEEASRLM